jgi:hypothetical protein
MAGKDVRGGLSQGHEISNHVVDAATGNEAAPGGASVHRSVAPTQTGAAHCGHCGAPVMTQCDHFEGAIPRINHLGGPQQGEPNPFCVDCGEPYPWATRAQRIGNLYNLMDFGSLTQAEEPEEEGSARHVQAGSA